MIYLNNNATLFKSVEEVSEEWPWLDITPEDCVCSYTGDILIVPSFLDLVQKLLSISKAQENALSLKIIRIYDTNDIKDGIKQPHALGRAVDFKCEGRIAFGLISLAGAVGFTGCGVFQSGPRESRVICLDDLTEKEGFNRPDLYNLTWEEVCLKNLNGK